MFASMINSCREARLAVHLLSMDAACLEIKPRLALLVWKFEIDRIWLPA
jgi:hypothetical protein